MTVFLFLTVYSASIAIIWEGVSKSTFIIRNKLLELLPRSLVLSPFFYYTFIWKDASPPLYSDVWSGFLRVSTAAVAPFYFGTKTWFSLDGFLWEWLYWSCPWCWAEYPALQHRLGTPVGGTPSDGLKLILTDVCMYAGFLFSLYWRSSLRLIHLGHRMCRV